MGTDDLEYSAYQKFLNSKRAELRAKRRLADYGSKNSSAHAEEILELARRVKMKKAHPGPSQRQGVGLLFTAASRMLWITVFAIAAIGVLIFMRNIAPEYGVIWIGDEGTSHPILEWVKRRGLL